MYIHYYYFGKLVVLLASKSMVEAMFAVQFSAIGKVWVLAWPTHFGCRILKDPGPMLNAAHNT
jgi:hypothetical protein